MVNRTELESVHVYRENQRVSGRAVVPLFIPDLRSDMAHRRFDRFVQRPGKSLFPVC